MGPLPPADGASDGGGADAGEVLFTFSLSRFSFSAFSFSLRSFSFSFSFSFSLAAFFSRSSFRRFSF